MSTEKEEDQYIVRSLDPDYEIPECSFGQYLQNTIINVDPNKVMMIDAESNGQQTYGELNQIALQLGGGLLQLGLNSTDRAMFYAGNSIDYFDLYVALAYTGLTFSPSKPANGQYETEQQLLDLQASVLIVSRDKLTVIRQMLSANSSGKSSISMLKLLIVLGMADDETSKCTDYVEIARHLKGQSTLIRTFNQIVECGRENPLGTVPHFSVASKSNFATDPAVIVYTSGTSGLAKGALLSHRAMIASIENYYHVESFNCCRLGATVANVYPFGHISGTLFTPTFLRYQMTVVIYPAGIVTEFLLQTVQRYRVDILPLLQSVSNDLYLNNYRKKFDLSSLKMMYYCGSKFPKHIVDSIRDRYCPLIDEFYGATEFMGSVFNRDDNCGKHPYGSVGSPAANIEMKIVDLQTGNRSLTVNQKGEICFRGPNCFVGYLNNPEATRETIDQDGWYHSGDVGYYDEKNRLFIADRIKELIKYKHWSVAPADVEIFLQSHPAVDGACVIGVKHQSEGYHLRAYVRLVEGKLTTKQELMDYVKDNMGYHKRLNGGVQIVPEIPRTIIGKVDRTFFKKQVQNEVLTKLALPD